MNDGIGAPLAKERGDAKTFPEYDPELGAAPEFTVGLRWAGATNVCDPAGSAIAWPWESNRGEPFNTTQVDWRKSTINFRVEGRLPTKSATFLPDAMTFQGLEDELPLLDHAAKVHS